ncbi:urease accessory protein UreE [Paraburkholderia caballeronis]|uniref:Urease accessory protein UreE n=1 Tax=Paraburkholderia caballeronis TaxID=416943 RepID=A0A1H7R6E8_9BURK|nr:urease accessory protein UreE [Paraburkholderia caballeronis]PXW23644.1 urease accessory protein [Paraburkholderia caballeronis]PXW98985.1 urease accessory protein [Paraburkholderia caballeronis]RAJ96191.1 urease accessory protein [Paraburkholderia caballeronis]SEC81257.1 urease accessory protein [Paraburkholderia caballeronis]SEL55505.1 urease accessory protein [Paraburkholderia caballeronis]
MRTIDKRLTAKLAPVLVRRAPTVTLAYDARCKSRFAATLDTGEEVGVVLPRGTVLRDGDVLVADDGGLVRVVAAAESVLLVRAPDRLTLTRAAYHLGNRHTPVEVGDDYLKLEADPVLEDMLKRLGARVARETQPFQPEAGAYGGGHRHGHDDTFADDYALAQKVFDEHHGHSRDHGHDHGHAHGGRDHSHGHGHAHDPHGDEHVHGPGCGHDHSHAEGHTHEHEHDHAHSHGHSHDEAAHVHGPDCGHDHASDADPHHPHGHAHR